MGTSKFRCQLGWKRQLPWLVRRLMGTNKKSQTKWVHKVKRSSWSNRNKCPMFSSKRVLSWLNSLKHHKQQINKSHSVRPWSYLGVKRESRSSFKSLGKGWNYESCMSSCLWRDWKAKLIRRKTKGKCFDIFTRFRRDFLVHRVHEWVLWLGLDTN